MLEFKLSTVLINLLLNNMIKQIVHNPSGLYKYKL